METEIIKVSDSAAMYTCENCSVGFDAKWKLERHKQNKKGCKKTNTIPLTETENNKCVKCNKTFSNKYNLARHKKKVCSNIIENIEDITLSNTARSSEIQNSSTMVDDIVKNVSPANSDMVRMIGNIIMQHNDMLKDHRSLVSKMINVLNQYAGDNVQQNQIPLQPAIQFQIPQQVDNIVNSNVQVNVQNNIVQNNVITNNLILPPVINPFGYEDISHISDSEKLRILTSPNGLELGLKLLYNKVSNRNFYRPNANKDNIAVLDTDLKVQIKDKKSFNDDMLEKGIVVMYRLLDSCKTKLSFKDKLMIEQNITRNRDMLRFDNYIKCVLNLIETCLQDNVSKDIFKKFSDKLSREETFRKEKLKLVKQLIDELKKFNTEFNNVSITDEYLKSEVWYIDESRNDDMDPHDIRNNLENNYIENTARYKMLEKMKEEEHKYFEDHDISLGNLRKYRMIQLDRARQEIELMNEIYKDDMLKEELENKLLNKNNDNFDSNLSRIIFIQEDNMLEI